MGRPLGLEISLLKHYTLQGSSHLHSSSAIYILLQRVDLPKYMLAYGGFVGRMLCLNSALDEDFDWLCCKNSSPKAMGMEDCVLLSLVLQ